MKNILIIGSSTAIKAFFQEKFKGDIIEYISFREAWKTQPPKKYDIIAVSGFHFNITSINNEKLNLYIKDYFSYIQKVSRFCGTTYLVSTKLKMSLSYSRVVFFYFSLLKMIFEKKLNINVLSFYSMLNPAKDKIKIKIFKILNKEFSDDYFKNRSLQELEIKHIENINFKYIGIKRSRFIDRVLRIFDK
jgi:hypothetical protein